MHVNALVLQLLRETFARMSELPGYPFTYTNDISTTGVLIDTEFNKESEAYGVKPAIIVSRGPVQSRPIAMGDRAESNWARPEDKNLSLVDSSIVVRVGAKNKGVVELVSAEILNFLISCRTVLPSLTGIHRIHGVSLGTIRKMREDRSIFYVDAVAEYSMQYKWVWSIDSAVLGSLGFYINDDHVFTVPSVEP